MDFTAYYLAINMTHRERSHVIACMIGNTIEWYEFSLFAYLSPIIAVLFFPEQSKITGLLNTLLIYASGFLIRPLGAIIIGHMGDTQGRAKALKLTMLLLSISSVITGCLPTYNNIGPWAPALLVLFRLTQGFCIGGEFAGSMIYLTESAPANRKALMSCMANNGSNIGILLSISACTLMSFALSEEVMQSFGWRVLFLSGGIIGLIGLWLRRDLPDTQAFKEIKKDTPQDYVPLQYLFKTQKKPMLRVFFMLFISASGSYTLTAYLAVYFHTFFHWPLTHAYLVQTLFLTGSLICVPTLAYLVDTRFNRRQWLLGSLSLYCLLSIPLLGLLASGYVVTALSIFLLLYSAEQAAMPATISDVMHGKGAYTGVSLPYNLSMGLVGGLSPALNTYLIDKFDNPAVIGYVVASCAFMSFLAILLAKS